MAEKTHIKQDSSRQGQCSCSCHQSPLRPIHPNPVVAWTAHQMNCLTYGQAVIAMLFYASASGVAVGVYVKWVCDYSTEGAHWITALTILIVVLAQHRIGWLLDRWGVIRATIEWHAQRTQTLRTLLEKVRGGK